MPGDSPLDREISALQRRVSDSPNRVELLDRLGWLLVSKARRSGDPGYYRLAEHAALAQASLAVDTTNAALLQGHALHSLHRFEEAEAIARDLVARRGAPYDFALLGDVLVDRGEIDEATDVYQRMLDLKPDALAYTRAGHLLYLKGRHENALRVLELAARSASPRNSEAFAWIWSRLALLQLRTGLLEEASRTVRAALRVAPDSAPALQVQGRVQLASGAFAAASVSLEQAARLAPMPDTLWMLSESLRADGHDERALAVEARLMREGEAADPRGFALYLASHGLRVGHARDLAIRELRARQDAHTLDAAAWAALAAGEPELADAYMHRALDTPTRDARLLYHAGVVAQRAGRPAEALVRLDAARERAQTLFPSERRALELALERLHTQSNPEERGARS